MLMFHNRTISIYGTLFHKIVYAIQREKCEMELNKL